MPGRGDYRASQTVERDSQGRQQRQGQGRRLSVKATEVRAGLGAAKSLHSSHVYTTSTAKLLIANNKAN